MWNEIVANLSKFPNAVLTGLDANGYPFSIRCQPQPSPSTQVLLIHAISSAEIQAGPANLLCHSHDQELWNLKSFQVLGRLELTGMGWVFHPERLLPGNSQGLMEQFEMIFAGQASAKKYLEKHGLARPKIAWGEFIAVQKAGRKSSKS